MSARLIHIVLIAVLSGAADTASAQSMTSNKPPEINITSDSAPGRLPSTDQRAEVLKTADGYLSMLEAEQYERAYAMMAEINQKSLPFARFLEQSQEFHKKAGPLKRRDILKITWTKDPTTGPLPGVYAAVDVASTFANVDRHCGFVVLYQKPAGGDFQIMRQERTFIDNDTAQKLNCNDPAPRAMWARLATYCPNYRPAERL